MPRSGWSTPSARSCSAISECYARGHDFAGMIPKVLNDIARAPRRCRSGCVDPGIGYTRRIVADIEPDYRVSLAERRMREQGPGCVEALVRRMMQSIVQG